MQDRQLEPNLQHNSEPQAWPGVEIRLADPQATQRFGQILGQILGQIQGQVQSQIQGQFYTPQGSSNVQSSFVLLLNGDLDSGKTTLVQGLGLGLGIADPIVSPTFTLVCEYPEGRVPLYHFDLYRLHPAEVAELALETYWDGSDYPPGILAIEWAERLPYLPPDYLKLELIDPADSRLAGRLVRLQACGCRPQQVLTSLSAALGQLS